MSFMSKLRTLGILSVIPFFFLNCNAPYYYQQDLQGVEKTIALTVNFLPPDQPISTNNLARALSDATSVSIKAFDSTRSVLLNGLGQSEIQLSNVSPGVWKGTMTLPTATGTVTFLALAWNSSSQIVAQGNQSVVVENTTSVSGFTMSSTFALRDFAPGGGWIFYDKGAYSDEWRYLEVGPQDIGYTIWGGSGTAIGSTAQNAAIGNGQASTNAIIAMLGSGTYAAKICDDSTLNGCSDWFLPSKNELLTVGDQLWIFGELGGFDTWDSYWTSTEYNVTPTTKAATVGFLEGMGVNNLVDSKTIQYYVRPVRDL